MKKSLISIYFLLQIISTSFAQPDLLWTRTFGGAGTDQGLGIIQINDDTFIMVGNETSFGGGRTDGWVMSLDNDGEENWSVYFGGNGYDRFYGARNINDDLVIAGYSDSQGAGRFDFWLLKLNNEGQETWSRFYGGGDHERCTSFLENSENGFALLGHTYSFGNGGGDFWLVVTDEDGEEMWTQTYGGNGLESGQSIVQTNEGDYVLAGHTNSVGEGNSDFYLIKVSDEGEEIWSNTYGGEDSDQCMSLVQLDDGSLVMAGTTVSFGENGSDFWLVKTNADGEEIWNQTFDQGGDELCRSVIETFDGGFMMTGHTFAYNDNRSDQWQVRTDSEGELLWAETFGGDLADVGVDLIQTDDGGYLSAGWTSSEGEGGLDIWMVRLSPEPAGVLHGFVLDAVDDEPLEGAEITASNGGNSVSDREGYFLIDPVWAGNFDLTASIPGYNDFTREDLNVEEGDTLEVVFRLTHPEFVPSRNEFEPVMAPGESMELEFFVSNEGNGPLEWTVHKGIVDLELEPWDLRQNVNIGEITEDSRIYGVQFIADHFYVCGARDNEPAIYVLNYQFDVVRTIDQPDGGDRYGFKDLAFDGNRIWGCIRNMVYGLTLDGEVEISFEVEYSPSTAITFDTVRECLWVASTTREPLPYDRDGNLLEGLEVGRHNLRIYGLSYLAENEDNTNLYYFHRNPDNDLQAVYKVNIENDEPEFITYLENAENVNPLGISITRDIDPYSLVFLNISSRPDDDGGDLLSLWQMDTNTEWIEINPLEGVIEADGSQEFELTIVTENLLPVPYPGELIFTHNALQGETRIPISLEINEGPHQAEQTIVMNLGWNMISAHLAPEDDDIIEITRDLVERDLLLMMKNGIGRFYEPEWNYNNIPGWVVSEGYLVKMRESGDLILSGETVNWDNPIDLSVGWQIVSYYPRNSIDAMIALAGIEEQLLIAKDGVGRFYVPEWDYSNMGNLRQGQGYLMKVSEAVELVYRREEQVRNLRQSRCRKPEILPTPQRTDNNMSLLILSDDNADAEIGVYCDDMLVGSGVLHKRKCGIAIWGDDKTTKAIDGAREGEVLTLKSTNSEDSFSMRYKTLSGENVYTADGLWIVEKTGQSQAPDSFSLISAFPNPFNSNLKIRYRIDREDRVSLKVFDLKGRLIETLMDETQKAGDYSVNWSGDGESSGIFLVRLESGAEMKNLKIILIK